MTLPQRAAVFVDKDGTLVDDVPWNVDPALLSFRPGALAALQALAAAGYVLFIASNQSGIALGRFTQAQFDALAGALVRRLADGAGVRLAAVLHCPHAPGADAMPQCPCRKPAPGMLLQAAADHAIDLARSWMVGDTLDDVEAGHRAGCRSVLYESGGETVWRDAPLRRPDLRTSHWGEIAAALVECPAAA